MGRVKLRCGTSSPLTDINAHVHQILFNEFPCQMLNREISGIGCPTHLYELNDFAEMLLLQPKRSGIKVSNSLNATPLEDAQGGASIHAETCQQLDPEIGREGLHSQCLGCSPDNSQELALSAALCNVPWVFDHVFKQCDPRSNAPPDMLFLDDLHPAQLASE